MTPTTYEYRGEVYELTPLQIDILETLETMGPITRGYNGAKGTLRTVMNTPRSTLYDNLEKLKDRGLVKRIEYDNGKQGRPKVFWRLSHHLNAHNAHNAHNNNSKKDDDNNNNDNTNKTVLK